MKKFLSAFLCLSLLFSLPALAAEPGEETAPSTFSDMENHWAKEVVEKYVAMGVINGYPDGTFRPDDLVTRAEAAKILTLTFGLEKSDEIRYTDLTGKEWDIYTDLTGKEWHYSYDLCAAPYLSLNVSPAWSANISLLQPYADNYYNKGSVKSGTAGRFLPEAHIARYQLADTLVELLAQREGLSTTVTTTVVGGSYSLVEEAFPDEYHPYIGNMPGGGVAKTERRLYDRVWIAYEQGIMVGDDGRFRAFDAVTRAELLTVIDRVLEREGTTGET